LASSMAVLPHEIAAGFIRFACCSTATFHT
jgi:hypothetical protein